MIDWYIEHHPFVLMVINILIARKLIHLIFFFFFWKIKNFFSEWRMKHISNRTHIQKQTGKQTLVAFGHSVNDNFEHHHHYRWRQYKSINRCCSSSSSCWWREIIYHEIYVCVCVCALQFNFHSIYWWVSNSILCCCWFFFASSKYLYLKPLVLHGIYHYHHHPINHVLMERSNINFLFVAINKQRLLKCYWLTHNTYWMTELFIIFAGFQ